jgi:hypothetical protein
MQIELNCGKTPNVSSVMQALRINQFAPRLRVVDSIECPLQLYCWNKLVVLYSYDNKSSVRAKHIVIMNMFCEKEEDIQDQIISLEQECTCASAN